MSLSGMLAHYSYKFAQGASVLALLMLLHAAPARADDDFSVDKVVADAPGVDATDARNKALALGEQEAFKQLITRMAPEKASEIVARVTPADISPMVQGFEVEEEKIQPEHYHAVLRYHFSPKLVRSLLPAQPAGAKADASGSTSKAILVLPVLNEGHGNFKLWQDDNKWRTIWYEAALESGSGLVVVPLGDMNDRVDVDDSNSAQATAQSLSRVYSRYGVKEVDILTAYYNLKADPKPALEIEVRRLSPTLSDTSHLSYTIRSTETLDILMARASNDIAKTMYKQTTIDKGKIEFARQKEIGARVNVGSVDEWVSIRKHLLTHGNIVNIRVTSVTNSQTLLVITYKGTPEMLGKTLVASGLRVLQDGDSLVLALQ